MQPFLNKTAKYLFEKFQDGISDICIVLPSRRGSLFFKKYLADKIEKPIWSPTIFSIEDFISEISELQIIDPITLLFESYKAYKNIEGKNAQDFETFINWGSILLHDFNELDLYLVNPDDIFSYLNEVKALEKWNLNGKPLSELELNYLKFYNSLGKYYKELSTQLLSKNQAYQGLAYRKVAEEIEDKAESLKWSKIIFVGFNALTSAEEWIIKVLESSGKAEILWDTDKYYHEDPKQEAGRFLRKYLKNKPKDKINWIENGFADSEKEIKIIGVPKNVGQTKLAGQILKDEYDSTKPESFAIVLADENLLTPLLNSIPENIEEFNVTMGLPLKLTPAYDFFNSLFMLHLNAEKLKNISAKNNDKNLIPRFYHKDITKLLSHSFLQKTFNSFDNDTDFISELINNIKKLNKSFFNYDELKSLLNSDEKRAIGLIDSLFNNWKNPFEIFEKLVNLISIIRDSLIETSKKNSTHLKIELEYLYTFSKIFKRLKSLSEEFEGFDNLKTLNTIFNQIVRTSTLPFYGEPLKGLQVMGMLETRTLDFDKIVLLSANEGLLPSAKSANTFIPYDIKREFKIPTHREKDAVFAYHFYRLLQRTKQAYILYNTEADQLGGGDKSRFITQIIHELPTYNPKIKITEQILSVPPVKDKTDYSIKIEKTEEVLEKLKEKAKSGFSPSSLNAYRNCSLRFYFQQIAGLKEIEEVEETIDAATLGTVVHEVLMELYTPYKNKVLSQDIIKTMIPQIESKVQIAFKKEYKSGDVNYGKNLLILKVANSFIKNFLAAEMKYLAELEKENKNYTILHLEEAVEFDLNENIKLKGFIDRIDKVDDVLRIIDYKTGKTEQKELTIKNWEDLIFESKHDKAFQLLTYAYLIQKSVLKTKNIESGIISFRNLGSGFMKVIAPSGESITTEDLNEFEIILKNLIDEILDKEIPFSQTEEADNCEYCAFRGICYR
ncbi:MAG: PD-(D/E)XK nuclease family protein [Saprospiraceae bacterium]|nr:PD-(D/E)XK nuclease family protein [Saprospiraceae bacterium]